MSQFTEAVEAVCEFAQQPITSMADFPPSDRQFFSEPCFEGLLQACHQVTPEEREEVLAALAPVIAATPDIFQASRVAMLCGVVVEWGADPAIAITAILDRLETQLAAAAEVVPKINAENAAELFAQTPELVKAWKGLPYMIMPAMTMLCLDVNLRQAARRYSKLIEGINALASVQREVKFVHRLLSFVDGEELFVLHPQENKGFRVRVEAIATNFHLFSLLQGALVGDSSRGLLTGPPPNRKVIATATGEMPHDRLITDSAVWHYYNWTGLQADGSLAPTHVTTWIMGEATPREIPYFEGERVILLGPPVLGSRSWDSSFFTNLHDALRSKVAIVEILSATEVELWLKRIRQAPRKV